MVPCMRVSGVKLSRMVSLPIALGVVILSAAALAGQNRLVAAVDPMIGTANEGNTYPGAAAPFGMIQWSPDTNQNFYYYDAKTIRGFSVTHLSGAGCPVFGDMPILPLSSRPGTQRD